MTVEEQENASDALMELIEHHENLRRFEPAKKMPQGGSCSRCHSGLIISSGFTYCPECNWDSLVDYTNTRSH